MPEIQIEVEGVRRRTRREARRRRRRRLALTTCAGGVALASVLALVRTATGPLPLPGDPARRGPGGVLALPAPPAPPRGADDVRARDDGRRDEPGRGLTVGVTGSAPMPSSLGVAPGGAAGPTAGLDPGVATSVDGGLEGPDTPLTDVVDPLLRPVVAVAPALGPVGGAAHAATLCADGVLQGSSRSCAVPVGRGADRHR
ncbi:hypothetical protein [Nocardioides rubriscoriae]|uniref:hypothetical protein n=1 Tax=Nocardioides rubriscoriae TaxID=642762 RepID=UPI0011E02FB3|nr:hypothetical protein [Nocardioides rubriscoriae]